MKLTKVAFAVASALVVAGAAHAGQIDSSSATLAIEVIKSDVQVVRAPSKTYNFAGDIDARTNEQRLQLQYTLAKGTWAVGAGNLITTADNLVDVSAQGTVIAAYTDAANAPQTTFPAGTAINAFVTNSGKTLVFNITVPAAAANLLRAPSITINPAALGAGNVGVTGLLAVAGATACVAPDQNLDINFKHFTNHTGAAVLQTVASPDSEHVRSGSTNDARLLNFTQNLDFKFTPAASSSRTSAATLNTTLSAPQNYSAALAAGLPFTGKEHYLGMVNLRQKSNGLDLDYVHTYGDSVAPFVATNPFIAGDFEFPAAGTGATKDAGMVELAAGGAAVQVTLSTAWPVGTVLTARDAAGAAIAGIADVTTIAGQTVLVLQATTPAAAAALANGVNVFAIFPGTALIPQSGGLATVASLTKAASIAAPDKSEQNNTCSGTLMGIGGGIKIDVRNYAAYATFGDNGPATTVRLINNSETQTADIYAQMIYADGTYGAWGQLPTLKPREVMNMSNKAIEALLTNAAATTNPFGGAAAGYTAKGGNTVVGGSKAGISDRLRIVSNTGSTLRVQSYMVVGNSVIDTSNAQGVDFENARDAVPSTAIDAQPVSQDAINGLSKQ